MSPEQCAEQPITPACDWYAVGVMIYEALTGRRPFEGSAVRVVVDKQTKDPPPPRSFVPDVPADLESLTLRLLARDPRARPGAEEILSELE
jgi:serine/threonine protein kinase